MIIKNFDFLFCIPLGLHKILTLEKANSFAFCSLIRIFALSLHKIGCTSEMKIKKLLFCISLGLHKILTLEKANSFDLYG